MTRISFTITSGGAITLGSNIESLPSIHDILNTVSYRNYQQCIPYLSSNILLKLKLCIPVNEISSWISTITKAVSAATGKKKNISINYYLYDFLKGQSNVNIMLKGVQEGVTTTG